MCLHVIHVHGYEMLKLVHCKGGYVKKPQNVNLFFKSLSVLIGRAYYNVVTLLIELTERPKLPMQVTKVYCFISKKS